MRNRTYSMRARWCRRFCAAFVCIFALSAASVKADLIMEPTNSFYSRHREECTYLNRAATASDDTVFWSTPDSLFRKDGPDAGEMVYISFVYTDDDGIQWGLAPGEDQWVLMSDLLLPYTSDEFMADHEAEIYEGTPFSIPAGTEAVQWSYPESGNAVDEAMRFSDPLELTTFFDDPDGRLWGYTYYYCGTRDIWVCLSDMNNTEIPQREVHEMHPAQAADEAQLARIAELKDRSISQIWLIVVPTAVVILLALFLIWFFWIRKRKS